LGNQEFATEAQRHRGTEKKSRIRFAQRHQGAIKRDNKIIKMEEDEQDSGSRTGNLNTEKMREREREE